MKKVLALTNKEPAVNEWIDKYNKTVTENSTIGHNNVNGSDNNRLLQLHKSAIFFSAFILVVTVSSMLIAKHPAIKSVGFSTLVGLLSAVILSYVLQPAIFRKIKK